MYSIELIIIGKSPFSEQKLCLKIELGEAAKSGDVFAPWLVAGK